MRLAICLIFGMSCLCEGVFAQVSSIVAGEYFVGTDPGVGSATPLPAFSANQNVDLSFVASTSGAPKGMHMLGIRVRDNNNVWSMPAYSLVYVMASGPVVTENISAAEYFFDNDPGTGNATAIPVGTAAPVIDVSFAAASSALSLGMHMFAIRIKNIYGEWGIPTYTPVYVDRDKIITKLEYFFDTDPGVGSATQISITPQTDALDQIFTMNSTGLSPAAHTLHVRVAGENNFWGIADTANFAICAAATPAIVPNVVCVGSPTTFKDNSTTARGDVYAWDYESNGKIDDFTSGDKTFTYPAPGTYTATLTIDRGGCIGSTTATVIVDDAATATAGPVQTICETGTAALIATVGGTAATGTWTTSGNGTFNNASALNPAYTPGSTDVSAGNVTVTFTTANPPGACNAVSANAIITIVEKATANAGTDTNICSGTSVTLSGTRGGSASTAIWSSSGDGSFDNANALNATYSPGPNDILAGLVNLTLTTNDPAGPCIAAGDAVALSITPNATVDAGPDQSICGNSDAILDGTVGGGAAGFGWSTAGDGTFNNPHILNAEYSPGPIDLAAGSMVLTLTTDPVGVCPAQSDQCTISLSDEINIVTQIVDATVADPVFVTVTSGGTFNTGDMLTSTIQGNPKKGVAQLQTGDVLKYVAGVGTVGSDSVQIQVCNQCNQCDAGYVFFNIQNAPPVINIPVATTTAGGKVIIPIVSAINDVNGNLDLSTLIILEQPHSGVVATIDGNHNLVLDYEGTNFSGPDHLVIQVCDELDACSQYNVVIEVGNISTGVQVYNAIAPKSFGDNRFMRIHNLPAQNKVTIYNRWGDKVFEVENYDHDTPGKRFEGYNENGKELPAGTYFYRIETPKGSSPSPGGPKLTGFLSLKQ